MRRKSRKSMILSLILLLIIGMSYFYACGKADPDTGNGNPGVQDADDENEPENIITLASGGLVEKASVGFEVTKELSK